MNLKDLSLVVPLMFRAFLKTYRSGRKLKKTLGMPPGQAREDAFRKIAKDWADAILKRLHVDASHSGEEPILEPCIFVGNHMSYLDIIVLNALHPPRFVAKAELQKWPIVGHAAKLGGTIFVKRDSKGSKLAVAQAIREGIQQDRKQIAVFPEGTTSLTGNAWRRGVFRIAHELQVPIQAFTIYYEPARKGAYIGKDHFFTHMIKLIATGGVKAHIIFTKPRLIQDIDKDSAELESWMRETLWAELRRQGLDPSAPVDV